MPRSHERKTPGRAGFYARPRFQDLPAARAASNSADLPRLRGFSKPRIINQPRLTNENGKRNLRAARDFCSRLQSLRIEEFDVINARGGTGRNHAAQFGLQ